MTPGHQNRVTGFRLVEQSSKGSTGLGCRHGAHFFRLSDFRVPIARGRELGAARLRLSGHGVQRVSGTAVGRMDGEAADLPAAQLDEHLSGCVACRSFAESAVAVNRRLRVRPAPALPDLSGPILARLARPERRAATPGRRRWPTLARVALGLVALAQLALGAAQLFRLSHMGMNMTAMAGMPGQDHLFNESTAWNIAVGIGLLFAGGWPRLARGFLAPLGVFVLVLTIVSIGDIVSRQVTAGRLESHVFLVLGLVLLFVVDRTSRLPAPVPAELPLRGNDWAPARLAPTDTTAGRVWAHPAGRKAHHDGQQRGRHAA